MEGLTANVGDAELERVGMAWVGGAMKYAPVWWVLRLSREEGRSRLRGLAAFCQPAALGAHRSGAAHEGLDLGTRGSGGRCDDPPAEHGDGSGHEPAHNLRGR